MTLWLDTSALVSLYVPEDGELFKIENNLIRRVEAIFIRGPYGVCSGWSTYEQCRSEDIQDVR